jgi:hypothetical protein
MLSVGSKRLTDSLWLAAHDGLRSRPRIGEKPLGVGLATGLLAELIYDGCLELRDGELFRTDTSHCPDPALQPLLDTMAAEERRWAPPHTPLEPRPHPTTHPRERWSPPDPASRSAEWPTQVFGIYQPVGAAPGFSTTAHRHQPCPPHEEVRHRRRGHDLRQWMSYLAYDRRAEDRFVNRLLHTQLVRKQQRLRLLGGATVRYLVRDSAVSGMPASRLRTAVQTGRRLDREELLLAGLVLATGLHHHALATLTAVERSRLADELKRGLDAMSRELLRAADTAIGDAAMH